MLGRRKGFTLIELLVVIAIIAILAAILFPVFGRARTAAKISKCIGNLRQIGTALALYVDDNDGKYPAHVAYAIPPGFTPPSGFISQSPGVTGLALTLSKYSKSSGIWMCPAGAMLNRVEGPGGFVLANRYTHPAGVSTGDFNSLLVGWAWGIGMPDVSTNYGSYALNRGLGNGQIDTANGKTPVDFYTTWRNNMPANDPNPKGSCGRLVWDMYSWPASGKSNWFFTHRGGANILYWDGRVSWLPDTRRTSKDL